MKITVDIENLDGRYNVQVSTSGFTGNEEEKLGQFGDPLIQVGGSFSGSATRPGEIDPVAVEFEFPEYSRRMRADFPVKRVFDLADSDNADIMAKVWADEITNRLTSAKTTLMLNVSPFVGETRTTV